MHSAGAPYYLEHEWTRSAQFAALIAPSRRPREPPPPLRKTRRLHRRIACSLGPPGIVLASGGDGANGPPDTADSPRRFARQRAVLAARGLPSLCHQRPEWGAAFGNKGWFLAPTLEMGLEPSGCAPANRVAPIKTLRRVKAKDRIESKPCSCSPESDARSP